MERNPIKPQPRPIQGKTVEQVVFPPDPADQLLARPARGGEGSGKGWRLIPIETSQLYELARIGCTQVECAQFFGICISGFEARLKNDPELQFAWQHGTAQAKIGLRRLQLIHAHTAGDPGVKMTIHLSKFWLGEREDQMAGQMALQAGPVKMTFAFETPASRLALKETNSEDGDE